VLYLGLDASIALVTVVGQNLQNLSTIRDRATAALNRDAIDIILTEEGSSASTLSLVVAQCDVKNGLAALHGEFGLGTSDADSQ
jgi:aspartokinase